MPRITAAAQEAVNLTDVAAQLRVRNAGAHLSKVAFSEFQI